jgi:tryptophan synthase alpha chain
MNTDKLTHRYDSMFALAEKENRGVFIPFLTVGDPNMDICQKALETLILSGADALELGIPFSDPVADGPVIQEASQRALAAGANRDLCFELISKIRGQFPDIPIGILTYVNAVMAKGYNDYFKDAAQAGIDSVLAADMPVHSAEKYIQAALKNGVAPVFIAPPNANCQSLEQIAKNSRGYTYVVSRKGVTGKDKEVLTDFKKTISLLKKYKAPRPVVGFGISTPKHVQAVIKAGASGAISGSATVELLRKNAHDSDLLKTKLSKFVQCMKKATLK